MRLILLMGGPRRKRKPGKEGNFFDIMAFFFFSLNIFPTYYYPIRSNLDTQHFLQQDILV